MAKEAQKKAEVSVLKQIKAHSTYLLILYSMVKLCTSSETSLTLLVLQCKCTITVLFHYSTVLSQITEKEKKTQSQS